MHLLMDNVYHPLPSTDRHYLPPLLVKIPQTPSMADCGNKGGKWSRLKVNWALFADRSRPKVDLMFALPQGDGAVTLSRPNNVIKIQETATVPDVLIREMLGVLGKGTFTTTKLSAPQHHLLVLHIPLLLAYSGDLEGLIPSTFYVYLCQVCCLHPC